MAKIILPDINEKKEKEEAISKYFEENPWRATVDLNYVMAACRYIQEARELIANYDFDAIDKKEENPAKQCHTKVLDRLSLADVNLVETISRSRPIES